MFENYRARMARRGNNLSEVLRRQSDAVVNATWGQSVACRPVMVKVVESGVPQFDELVDEIFEAQFEQKSKYNITGDEVSFWLRFRPHTLVDHPEINIGTYVSIPDSDDVRETWMIVHIEDDNEQKWLQILRCNWTLQWIVNGTIHKALCVMRYASSYNSGSWAADRTTLVENMNGVWLPTNLDSDSITYDQRFIISDGGRDTPICWSVSKVETTIPVGISKFTLTQVPFDPIHDNAALGIADYYSSSIPLDDSQTESDGDDDIIITYNGNNPTIKVGSSKIFTADLMPDDTRTLTWSVVDEAGTYTATTDNYTLITANRTLELKVAKNYNLIGRLLTIQAEDEDGVIGEIKVEVV